MSRKKTGPRRGEPTVQQPEASRPAGETTNRQHRLAAREAEAQRERRRRQLTRGLGAAALVAAALFGGVWLYNRLTEPVTWQSVPDQGNAHLAGSDSVYEGYNSDPPTSGPHAPMKPTWGVHPETISKALQVHALEDGGVLVQYNCPSGCLDLVTRLESTVRRYRSNVILAPYPGMPHRIALTAWTKLDAFDEFDEARIVRFIEKFRGIDHHAA